MLQRARRRTMKDSVETVGLFHNILIGVCAAILAFATSPDKTDFYRSLLVGLTSLRSLHMEEYPVFVAAEVPEASAASIGQYAAILKKAGYPAVAPDFYIPKRIYASQPASNATISDLIKFFEGRNEVSFTAYDPNSLSLNETSSTITPAYRYPAHCVPTHIGFVKEGVDFANDRTVILSSPPASGSVEVVLAFWANEFDMNCRISIPARIGTTVGLLGGTYARSWLLSKKIAADQLIVQLKQAEDLIGAKTLEDAFSFLGREVNAPRRDLSFLGLTIDAATAIYVGPVSTLMLVLYLLAQLRHLRATMQRRDDGEDYSWIGLFVDRLSISITYSSLVLLPAIANLCLIIASQHVYSAERTIGIVCTVGILVCGIFSGLEIHELHRMVRAKLRGNDPAWFR